MHNRSSLFESLTIANTETTEKSYFNLQFASKHTIRIHSSQKRRTPFSQPKNSVMPYKGPPPRTITNNFFQPVILTQQRSLRRSEPNLLEGIVKQVCIQPRPKTGNSAGVITSSSQDKKSPAGIKRSLSQTDKFQAFRIPVRAAGTDRSPVKPGCVSERSYGNIGSKESVRIRIDSKRVINTINNISSVDDRYSNITFVKNERSRSQCDLQNTVTSADLVLSATDNRYSVIEESMRDYSLEFIPENSKYTICQNPQTQNYFVIFTGKSVPTCKECLVPISIELSHNYGFRIICKSGFCSKQILYRSRLNNYTIQELWGYSLTDNASILITEKQEVSKMIQNGAYRHKDITKTFTDFKQAMKRRPETSFSPLRNQSRRSDAYSLPTSMSAARMGRTRKSEMDWRNNIESFRETKGYFNTRGSFSRAESPYKLESFLISKNNSMRDFKNEEIPLESKEDKEDLFELASKLSEIR